MKSEHETQEHYEQRMIEAGNRGCWAVLGFTTRWSLYLVVFGLWIDSLHTWWMILRAQSYRESATKLLQFMLMNILLAGLCIAGCCLLYRYLKLRLQAKESCPAKIK